jgi:GNAT superfamily N-acetyltransferase
MFGRWLVSKESSIGRWSRPMSARCRSLAKAIRVRSSPGSPTSARVSLLAFDGDQHVGQLQFRRYEAGTRSPHGVWDPLFWMDFDDHAPDLPPGTLCVFCYHIGQLESTPDRDERYQGRGVGARLLDCFLDWVRAENFDAVIAKATPPHRPVMGFLGGLPAARLRGAWVRDRGPLGRRGSRSARSGTEPGHRVGDRGRLDRRLLRLSPRGVSDSQDPRKLRASDLSVRNNATPYVPIGHAWRHSSADVLCARSVRIERGSADLARIVVPTGVSSGALSRWRSRSGCEGLREGHDWLRRRCLARWRAGLVARSRRQF